MSLVPNTPVETQQTLVDGSSAAIVITRFGAFVTLPPNGVVDLDWWGRLLQIVDELGFELDEYLESAADFEDGYGDRFAMIRKGSRLVN